MLRSGRFHRLWLQGPGSFCNGIVNTVAQEGDLQLPKNILGSGEISLSPAIKRSRQMLAEQKICKTGIVNVLGGLENCKAAIEMVNTQINITLVDRDQPTDTLNVS